MFSPQSHSDMHGNCGLNFSMLKKKTLRGYFCSALLPRWQKPWTSITKSVLRTCGQIHLKPVSAQRSHREEAHPEKLLKMLDQKHTWTSDQNAAGLQQIYGSRQCCGQISGLPSEKPAVEDGVGTTCMRALCSFEAITYSYSFVWRKCLVETQKVSRSTVTKPPVTRNKFFGARLLPSFFWCCWATCTGFCAIRLEPGLYFCIKAVQNLRFQVHVIADPTQHLIA